MCGVMGIPIALPDWPMMVATFCAGRFGTPALAGCSTAGDALYRDNCRLEARKGTQGRIRGPG
jgi:hypothetical protein